MRVGIVGSGPAPAAVRAALGDIDAEATAIDVGGVNGVDLGVVAGSVGSDRFLRANGTAGETPWLAVELGGVGGHAVTNVSAAVSGFTPTTGCYECLRTRVAANIDNTGDTGDVGGIGPVDARFVGALAGREAVRLLAGEESVALGGVVEVPHAQRRFLPVPGCECTTLEIGSAREYQIPREYESYDVEASLKHAERAHDGRVGLIPEVGEAESFPAPYYLATLSDTSVFSDAAAPGQAAGVAADWNEAFVKALGEALERYSAAVYREADLLRAPAAVLEDAVPPARFVCSPAFEEPDPHEDLLWMPGEDLTTGECVRLPAEFVAFPPPSRRHRPAITTGLGLGNSGVEAILSGLYEVVERDAAMLTWYSTFEPLGLVFDDEGYAMLARRAHSEDLETTALLLTQDVDVPVVAAAVHREGAWPEFAVGMSADLDPAAAARGALAEALQNWMELRGMGPDGAADESGAIGHYASFPEVARAFVNPETIIPARSVGPAKVPEGAAELEAVLDRVFEVGLDAYAARLTTRDVEALGFEVVRVLMPAAQPLFTDDPYFGERARQVPTDLGFEPRLEREHHPFP